MILETPTRSVIKSISYRILGTLTTALIAYFLTSDFKLAFWAGGLDVISKIVLYFVHERVWNKVHFGKRRIEGKVFWITGLPASGKTTLANALQKQLREQNISTEIIDGDEIRTLFPELGFDPNSRNQHIKRVAHLASVLEKHNIWVLVSLVSPYRESRDFARSICKNFVEIYLNTPLETCQARDPKNLYKQAKQGLIQNLTGVQSPYEAPLHPEFSFDNTQLIVDELAKSILKKYL